MRGLLRAAVAAFLMRVVGRRVEEGQPRRRFMGGSWEEEGWDIVVMVGGTVGIDETLACKTFCCACLLLMMASMGGRIGSS
jgi:hypothetical protein